MTAFIIILVICLLVYFIFRENASIRKTSPENVPVLQKKSIENLVEKDSILIDEDGKKYKVVQKSRLIPRQTFLYGNLQGKYWGEIDVIKEKSFQHLKFYDFNIYEVEISNAVYQFTAFNIPQDDRFPREKLPNLLPITLQKDGKSYALNIHEPKVYNVVFDRKLHQDEGKEVFGTIHGDITGYILDFKTEEYVEKEYIEEQSTVNPQKKDVIPGKTLHPTGRVEQRGDYSRTEYFYSDYQSRYWGNWIYKRPIVNTFQEGCLSSGVGVLGSILGVLFLLLIIPRLLILLPFILLPLLFGLIPSSALKWIYRVFGGLLLLAFIVSMINAFKQPRYPQKPTPIAQEEPQERYVQNNPIVDNVSNNQQNDTLIMHYRNWKDYEGNLYEGTYWVKKSDLLNAKSYKLNLSVPESTEQNYDKILYSLKENDKNNLNGLYQLFDSLKSTRKIDTRLFAEMVVCFVQDIPYAVVLPDACDARLYADNFIRNYLVQSDAQCDGFEKFGINTPVEFLATSKGDCDTRTLLLYTVLAHYGYDVALLSSEFYNHSLIGLNLPYEGVSYKYRDQHYILWETTVGIKPGILPAEISNINYWRISLKSK